MKALSLSRGIAALAILVLAAGGTLAASPSPSPVASAGSSASPSAGASAVSNSPSLAPAAASKAPVKSEAPKESEAPEKAEAPETPDSPPTAAEVSDFVGRLKAAGISTTDAAFAALAAKVGVGGAVRTLAFAKASGKTPDQIVAMFQGGKGWGQIKHELALSIGPGIGWIMGGGHGQGNGAAKKGS